MNRFLALALVVSLGNASAVFAGESILTSGARHVQQLAAVESSAAATIARVPAPAGAVVTVGQKPTPSFQAEGGTISKSGMGKGKKTMIYVGLAVAFAATVWTIDHNVLDITPSSLGTRQD
jgi:hypothetical protein